MQRFIGVMRKLREDYFKNYSKAISSFLIFMLVVMLAFFYCIQKEAGNHVEDRLMENLEKQNYHVGTILDNQYAYMEGIASFLGESDDILTEQNMNLIR